MARDTETNEKKTCENCEHYGDKFCVLWLCHINHEDVPCVGYKEKKEEDQ